MRCGEDQYTLGVNFGKFGNTVLGGRKSFLCSERYFGGRALDGYFVVQIQALGSPNSTWLEADPFWKCASSNPPVAKSCEMLCYYLPDRMSSPVDASGCVRVC